MFYWLLIPPGHRVEFMESGVGGVSGWWNRVLQEEDRQQSEGHDSIKRSCVDQPMSGLQQKNGDALRIDMHKSAHAYNQKGFSTCVLSLSNS